MAAGRNSAVKPSNSVRWLLGETAPSNLQTLSDDCWEKQRRQTFKPCPMAAGRNSAFKPSNPVRWLLGETAPSKLQTLSDGFLFQNNPFFFLAACCFHLGDPAKSAGERPKVDEKSSSVRYASRVAGFAPSHCFACSCASVNLLLPESKKSEPSAGEAADGLAPSSAALLSAAAVATAASAEA